MCQMNKYENNASPRLLQPLSLYEGVFTDITIDFIDALPNSKGKIIIIVVVDRLTKYVNFYALQHSYTTKMVA